MNDLFQALMMQSHALESFTNHEGTTAVFIRFDEPHEGHRHHCYLIDFGANVVGRGEPTLIGCGPTRSRIEQILLADQGLIVVDEELRMSTM